MPSFVVPSERMSSQSSLYYVSCSQRPVLFATRRLTIHCGEDQSPPKREYKVSDPAVRNLSLAELDFAPSSLLMLQFEAADLNRMLQLVSSVTRLPTNCSTDQDVPAPLEASILALIEDYPVPKTFEDGPIKDGKPDSSKPRGNFTFGKKDGNGERKLPKWLKLGPSTHASVTLTSLSSAHIPPQNRPLGGIQRCDPVTLYTRSTGA